MRRLLLLTAVALLVLPIASSAASVPWPTPPRTYTAAIEAMPPYNPERICRPYERVGTIALANLIVHTYPGTTYGTVRPCSPHGEPTSTSSEHFDGRAIDWMVSARVESQREKALALIHFLLYTDRFGNKWAMLRRLGVMYIIWDNKIWGVWNHTWSPYSTCAQHPETSWDNTCHRTHVHLSLTWFGALKETSFWTGKVAQYP